MTLPRDERQALADDIIVEGCVPQGPFQIRRHAVIPDAYGVVDHAGKMICLAMTIDAAEFICAALRAPAPEPVLSVASSGWKLLPIEPTDEMANAMIERIEEAQKGEGAPFKWPDIEHMYDIYCAAVGVAVGPEPVSAVSKEADTRSAAVRSRDDFLENKGLWSEYAASIPEWEKKQADAILALFATPQEPTKLTESERHNIEHMRYSFEHASEDNPDCCFDFDLIGGVLKTIDRLLAATPQPLPSAPTNADMEERIARAMCRAQKLDPDELFGRLIPGRRAEPQWQFYVPLAKSVIEEIGRPSAWRDISSAPKDGTKVIVWCDEGLDIAWWSAEDPDGSDSMGHDAGWWGMCQPIDPGRHMGNPEYFREAENQPWAWTSVPNPPYDDLGARLFDIPSQEGQPHLSASNEKEG